MRTFALLALIALTSGCVNVRIARPDHWSPQLNHQSLAYEAPHNAYTVSSAATTMHQTNLNVYFWGGTSQVNIDPGDCAVDGLAEVRVHRSFCDQLATLLTLGMWQPMTIQWRCAKLAQPRARDF